MPIPSHIDTSNMTAHHIRNLAEPQRVAAPFRADTDKPVSEDSPIIEWIPGAKDQSWDGPDYNGVVCEWDTTSETDIHGVEVDWEDNNPYEECEGEELGWYVNSVWIRERSRAIPLAGGEPHQMELVKDTGIMDQFHSTFCLACALRLRLITQDQIKAAGMEDELKEREASRLRPA
jgi:hypothetical protein